MFYPEVRPHGAGKSQSLKERAIGSSPAQNGFGPCAAELIADDSFIGFVGLAIPNFTARDGEASE
jgi:hypothetical protein